MSWYMDIDENCYFSKYNCYGCKKMPVLLTSCNNLTIL